MKEIILCKYGEIVLKGLNKRHFEAVMLRQLSHRIAPLGKFEITSAQSVAYIEPTDEECDIDAAYDAVCKIFGIVSVCRAAVTEKNFDSIVRTVGEYILPAIRERGAKTFKVESKRGDKSFPMTSPELSGEVGAELLGMAPELTVDVHEPDVVVHVEIRAKAAYVHIGGAPGAGGLPYGSGGKGMLLLSGGIDSPVAGWMMAKRGVALDCVHFESYPYTSEQAREKVLELARLLSRWCGPVRVHIISLTHIQEELRRADVDDYFTLLLRRYMMRLACRAARRFRCDALITGESLGQVASQTMGAFRVTGSVADRIVFRPCIGMDKEEIVALARRIGTFDTSILPYEDCCTVFTPKHPKTKPEPEKVLAQEAKLDFAALEDEAFAGMYTVTVE